MAEHFEGRRCATDEVSTGDRARLAELEDTYLRTTRIQERALTLSIQVRFIHVHDGPSGLVSSARRAGQIAVLNEAYDKLGIRFQYDESEVGTVENADFFRMGHQSARERTCKTTNQAVDPRFGLNFYTAEPGGGLLGWATFPYQMEGDPVMDGVVILHSSLPGGEKSPYNRGKTAVHEIGHWLGLYHTFQDGCQGLGDEVGDTPPHAGPNYGKPRDADQPHNLCPTAEDGAACPIHNYMNYVDDEWMTEFTDGQRTRIWAQIGMFRRDLLLTEGRREAEFGDAVVW